MEKVKRGDGMTAPEGAKKARAAGDCGDPPTKTCQPKAAGSAEPHRHRGGGWMSQSAPHPRRRGQLEGRRGVPRRRRCPGQCPRRSAAHLCWRRCRAARRRGRGEGGGRRRGAEGRPSRRRVPARPGLPDSGGRGPARPTPSLPRRRRRAGTPRYLREPRSAPLHSTPGPAPPLQHDVTGAAGAGGRQPMGGAAAPGAMGGVRRCSARLGSVRCGGVAIFLLTVNLGCARRGARAGGTWVWWATVGASERAASASPREASSHLLRDAGGAGWGGEDRKALRRKSRETPILLDPEDRGGAEARVCRLYPDPAAHATRARRGGAANLQSPRRVGRGGRGTALRTLVATGFTA